MLMAAIEIATGSTIFKVAMLNVWVRVQVRMRMRARVRARVRL